MSQKESSRSQCDIDKNVESYDGWYCEDFAGKGCLQILTQGCFNTGNKLKNSLLQENINEQVINPTSS